MHRGYVKLWRKTSDSKMYRSHKLWALWTWLLMNVTHKEIEVYTGLKKIKLYPGQIVCGRKQLAHELRLSERSVRTCLFSLQTTGNLTIKTTNKYSIITIVNWSTYQSDDEKTTNKTTNERPASDQQVTTKQEHKNVKNEKNIYPAWLNLEVWAEYKKYRQNGKGKFTPYAQSLALKKLEKLRAAGNDPSEVLMQTIERGWSGLFEVKGDLNMSKPAQPKALSDADIEALNA